MSDYPTVYSNAFQLWQVVTDPLLDPPDEANANSAERRAWQLTAGFLNAHHKGEVTLPVEVARWLHRQIDEMLAGNPPLQFQRQAPAKTPTETLKMCERTAVEFIHLTTNKIINLTESQAIKFASDAFGRSEDTIKRWTKQQSSWGGLTQFLRELAPGVDPTAFAKLQIEHLGSIHKKQAITAKERARKWDQKAAQAKPSQDN